jgi:cyclophilin family peptidyl-prolyl cis-trans isomerase
MIFAIVMAGALMAAASAKPARPVPPAPKSGPPRVHLRTNHGDVVIELFDDKAPKTVQNFLQYVDDRFYDGMIFHRVIADFMIQGGGFMPGMKEKPGRPPIINEADNGLSNQRGTIAVARTADPNSATSQFYINVKDNSFLDKNKAADKHGWCVFGKVIDGMDVVDRIRRVETRSQGAHRDIPVNDVVIFSVRRIGN